MQSLINDFLANFLLFQNNFDYFTSVRFHDLYVDHQALQGLIVETFKHSKISIARVCNEKRIFNFAKSPNFTKISAYLN